MKVVSLKLKESGKVKEVVAISIGEDKAQESIRKALAVGADKYFGELKNDKFDGQGTFTWSDGGQYIGEFKNGKYNGQGEYTYGNGEWEGQKYVGTFKNGKYNGQGTYTWSDGRKFVGEFILGRFWNGF